MKKIISVAVIALLMIFSYALGRRHRSAPATQGTSARRVLYWVDPMHPAYKSDHPGIAPDCGMPLEPVYADSITSAMASSSASPGTVDINADKQQLFGIRVTPVERSSGAHNLRILGRVVPEDIRIYTINSGTEGFIRETFKDSVGGLVKKDQKLATCYGPEFLSVASGFLAATERVPGATGKDGARTMPFPGAVAKQGVSSLQGYTDRLRNLGMNDAQIRQMADSRQLPESVDVLAPVDGFILSRSVSAGQHFERGVEFYRIADLSQVWVVADLLGSETQQIRPGAVAWVGLPNQRKRYSAHVTSVLPQVDPATRTLKLRLEVDNRGFALRPDMFVDVELPVSVPAGLTVPLDALIDSGREHRVYVERSSGLFEARQVQTGWSFGDRVEIVQGLTEGERVVTAGTFLVDSESRLKSLGQAQPEHDSTPKNSARSKSQPRLAVHDGDPKDAVCNKTMDGPSAISQDIHHAHPASVDLSENCSQTSPQTEHRLALNQRGARDHEPH